MPITYRKRKRPEGEEGKEDGSHPGPSSTYSGTARRSEMKARQVQPRHSEEEEAELKRKKEERRRRRKQEEYEDTVGCLQGMYKGEQGGSSKLCTHWNLRLGISKAAKDLDSQEGEAGAGYEARRRDMAIEC
jgi:hypothetical protein